MPVTVTVPAVVVLRVSDSPLPPAWMVKPGGADLGEVDHRRRCRSRLPALTVVAVPAAVFVTLIVSPPLVPLTIKRSRPE